VAPESINAFCREIGITRNANVIPYHKLEHHVRLHLDANSPRTLAVLRPLKVSLEMFNGCCVGLCTNAEFVQVFVHWRVV
jgi:glutamyl/glutaminyl-tRNA synthetase